MTEDTKALVMDLSFELLRLHRRIDTLIDRGICHPDRMSEEDFKELERTRKEYNALADEIISLLKRPSC